MFESDDQELLAAFAGGDSERAFATLVARYVNLVYSAAFRLTGNPHHAQEITQAVFIILARKAGGLGRATVLSGWLYQTARLTAANFMKGEIRRQHREQEAYMQSTLNEPDTAAWEQLAPFLDEAMGRLGDTDRNALVLRYFENKSAAEVASALKTTEAAAHKRTARALEKLRKIFSRRGMVLPVALIAGAVAANSVQAAPAGVAATVTAAAVKDTIISTTLTTVVKGTMKTMTWLKLKTALGVALAVLLIGGAATVAISETGGEGAAPLEIAKQTQAAYAALTSYSDTCTGTSGGAGSSTETTCTIRLQRPNQYRVEWTSTGGLYASHDMVWSDGSANYEIINSSADKFAAATPETARDMQQAFATATGVSGAVASTVPCAFFKLNFGDTLRAVASGRTELTRQADETISGVDCYVVVSVLDAAKIKLPPNVPVDTKKLGTTTNTFWIGKRDHLIRKVLTITAGMTVTMKFTDEMLTAQLARQNKPATPENIAGLRAQMDAAMKAASGAGFTFTETHENIVVNQNYSATDFVR